MIDPFGRSVTYLRLSVTDRCDLRCTYCMSEKMTFLPKRDLLTLEELDRLSTAFITKGVKKLRITGGEPLVRKDVLNLIDSLSRHLRSGALEELTLTTNGTQLKNHAARLARAGVRRLNVSIDSLIPETYARVTRGGDLGGVLDGIKAATDEGMQIKINAVALKQDNADELGDMIEWAHGEGHDFTVIEAMPMGEIGEDRFDQYIPLSLIQEQFETRWQLTPLAHRTGGPARYVRVEETGGQLGFITPLTHNFCEGCNRVRLTCTGQLYMCLGQEDNADLRAVMRDNPGSDEALASAIDEAISRKPKGHDFVIDRPGSAPAVPRHMSVTGG
ncbi:GTP 3',8-cyclase MoaA [Pyruvatibacter sp.]|uniref:GTP 3',8-cyclase MoaA n=1 Tax=Pyruvatibacter sp. TaxID=1981328 RepID=UPI0032647C53